MINLLDGDAQKLYRAARLNLKLRTYFTFMLIALVLVVGVFAVGLYLTMSERELAKAEGEANAQLVQQYTVEKQQAETFTNNLKIAKAILAQEILYSDLIVKIAQALPANSILSSLSLDQTALTKPITLTARVVNQNDAVVLKNALEASTLFENVNINSVAVMDVSQEKNTMLRNHPVVVVLSLKMSSQSGSTAQ